MAVWGATQYLRIWKESAWGTDPTGQLSPVEGTDFIWIRLDQNNAFTMRPVPDFWTGRSADGGNRRVQTLSSFRAYAGALNTLFFPTQAPFLLDMAGTLAGSPNNLPSFTIDHFDGVRTRRYVGCMVRQLQMAGTAADQVYRLAYQLQGKTHVAVDPTDTPPDATNFPLLNQVPYTHYDSKGQVRVNNIVRVNYSSMSLTIANRLGMTRDEDNVITSLFYAGRDVDWELRSQYTAVTDRDHYEAVDALVTNQIKWVKGGNSVTMDLKSSNFIMACNDDLPLDNAEYQSLSGASYFDTTATTDLAFTAVVA